MYEELRGPGFEILAVDVSGSDDEARKYLAENGITFVSLHGDWQQASALYGMTGTPTSLVIDPRGRIVFTEVGFDAKTGIARLKGMVETVLNRQGAT